MQPRDRILQGMLLTLIAIVSCRSTAPAGVATAHATSTLNPTSIPPTPVPTATLAASATSNPSAKTPTPDLEATQAALASPTPEPLRLPDGALLVQGYTEARETRAADQQRRWPMPYSLVHLPDLTVSPHPTLADEYPLIDGLVAASATSGRLAFDRSVYSAANKSSASIYVLNPDGAAPVQLTSPIDGYDAMSWSFDGRFLAFWTHRSGSVSPNFDNLSIYDAETGTISKVPVRVPFEASGEYTGPRLSPHGDRIAFQVEIPGQENPPGLYVMNADGSDVKLLMEGQIPNEILWHPDGTRLFVGITPNHDQTERRIFSYDLAMGAAAAFATGLAAPETGDTYEPLAISPDGKRMVFGAYLDAYSYYVIDVAGGTPLLMCQDPDHCVDWVWSPDSQLLAYMVQKAGGGSQLYVADTRGSQPVLVYTSFDSGLLAWLP